MCCHVHSLVSQVVLGCPLGEEDTNSGNLLVRPLLVVDGGVSFQLVVDVNKSAPVE